MTPDDLAAYAVVMREHRILKFTTDECALELHPSAFDPVPVVAKLDPTALAERDNERCYCGCPLDEHQDGLCIAKGKACPPELCAGGPKSPESPVINDAETA